jgi:hypothetical protein
MTLILTATSHSYVVQVSDRLATLWNGKHIVGPFDTTANKNLTYLGFDGAMTLGFAGPAYIGDQPTDDWIASILADFEFPRRSDGAILEFGQCPIHPLTLNQACYRLTTAIDQKRWAAAGLHISIGGFRARRHRLAPFSMKIYSKGWRTVKAGDMRLRLDATGLRLGSVGAPWSRDQFLALVDAHPQRARVAIDADVVADILCSLVREVASQRNDVGKDLMIIKFPRYESDPKLPRIVEARFKPSTEHQGILARPDGDHIVPLAFWPWLITPGGYRAPSASVGSGATFNTHGWSFPCTADGIAMPPGLFFAQIPIRRPDPPKVGLLQRLQHLARAAFSD